MYGDGSVRTAASSAAASAASARRDRYRRQWRPPSSVLCASAPPPQKRSQTRCPLPNRRAIPVPDPASQNSMELEEPKDPSLNVGREGACLSPELSPQGN